MKIPALHDQLPTDLAFDMASFYRKGSSVTNLISGTFGRYQYVAFDYATHGEVSQPHTVVAVKVDSPRVPNTNLSCASGLQLERAGPWILAFEHGRLLSKTEIGGVLADIVNLLDYAQTLSENA